MCRKIYVTGNFEKNCELNKASMQISWPSSASWKVKKRGWTRGVEEQMQTCASAAETAANPAHYSQDAAPVGLPCRTAAVPIYRLSGLSFMHPLRASGICFGWRSAHIAGGRENRLGREVLLIWPRCAYCVVESSYFQEYRKCTIYIYCYFSRGAGFKPHMP